MATRESLRAEARRRGVSVSRVRTDRAVADAIARGQAPPTAREATGHRRPGQPAPQANITAYLADPARASMVLVDIPTARRIGKHDELARVLAEGGEYRGKPLTPARFAHLVSRWAPITVSGGEEEPGQYRLLADPELVLLLLDLRRTAGAVLFYYERVR